MMRKCVFVALCLCSSLAFAGFARSVVRWDFPLRSCHEGLPFGNARSGCLVFGEGNVLKVTLGRDDTWYHKGGYPWTDEQSYSNIVAVLKSGNKNRLAELFAAPKIKPGDPVNPIIIPVGRFEFTLPDDLRLLSGELDTGTGLAGIALARGEEDDAPVATVGLAMDRATGALAIRFPPGMKVSVRQFPAWKKDWVSAFDDPVINIPGPTCSTLPGGEQFVQPIPGDEPIVAGYRLAGNEATIASSRGADLDPLLNVGYAQVVANSKAFWADWWRATPEIDVPDPIIREIHDLGMYKFGSMAGADGVPAPLQGPWIEDYRLPPWHGDYHFNINVQLCYWPAFRGNHLEALKPLFKMVLGWRPLMRENARKFAGIDDGYMLAHSVDDRGTTIGGYWAGMMDFAVSPWICQMMMRYVRMSGDLAFLRDEGAYDFMKGVMRVLRAIMRDDGQALSYPVSTSPEFDKLGGWGENSSFQLAATHRLAKDLVEAAAMLGEEPDPMWSDVKGRLPLASFKDGWGGEIELWKGLTLPETHRHHSHLAGFVPFDTLDIGQWYVKSSIKKTLFAEEWFGQGWWSGWSYGWYAMLQTRWGNADAAEWLLKTWERMYTNPGHGSRHDVYFPGLCVMRRGTNADAYGVVGDAPGEEIMQIDGAMACTAAVHAMMLDECFGKTYVFRGAPTRWRDCSFRNVLSDCGILVSAERRRGKVAYVEFKAPRGGYVRLVSPWRPGALIEFSLKPGETRRITEKDPSKWTDQMQDEWDKLKIEVKSSLDGTMQPAYFKMPEDVAAGQKVPLFVVLHSWSFGYTMLDPAAWGINEAAARGWAFLYPHFRGPNKTPQACGSDLAVQDIADQVAWVKERYPIDADRVYILGGSGGGHMALLMAGRHPEIWAGVYAACPPADLAGWYADCKAVGGGTGEYCNMLKAACGGTPDEKPEEYRRRSPVAWLENARGVPIQICTGIHDGHMYKGAQHSVLPGYSIRAFNLLADDKDRIPEQVIEEINLTETVPASYRFAGEDPFFNKGLLLMRMTSGNARLSLMDAGHGGNYRAGCDWLDRQVRGRPVDWTLPGISGKASEVLDITR